MKKRVIAFSLTLFTFMFSCCAHSQCVNNGNIISTSSEITKEVEPNSAILNFTVETVDKNSQKASLMNNKLTQDVINSLKSLIDEKSGDKIKTSNYVLYPNYSSRDKRNTIDSYTCKNTITVEISNLSKVGNFIDTAISNGAKRVDGMDFKLKNQSEICNQIYPEVVFKALNQAKVIARSLNTQVIGIKKLNASCNAYYENNYRTYGNVMNKNVEAFDSSASSSSGSTTIIEPGKIKVRAHVYADFSVK